MLDLLMPNQGGLEFLREYNIKKHPNVKVIVFSNMASPELYDEAKQLGATQYLIKANYTPKDAGCVICYNALMHTYDTHTAFERTTRQIRWLTIALVIIAFPLGQPQTGAIYLAAGLAAAYNLLRYWPPLLKQSWFASPITIIALDGLLGAILLMIVGRADTPYTGVLVLMLISAAYRYGLRGAMIVAAAEAAILWAATASPWYGPLVLAGPRIVVLGTLVLLTIGLLVDRLTHVERQERADLERLSRENEFERKRLFTLVNSLNDAIFVLDAKGRIVLHNGAAQALAESHQDLNGQELGKVVAFRSRSNPAKIIDIFDILDAESASQRRRDLQLGNNDDNAVDLDITVMPVQMDDHNNQGNFIVVCRDITRERSLDQQREEFIAVASHELRTPLAIIEAALSTALVGRAKLPPETTTLLDQAHRNTMFLSGLVRDLTTLSEAQNDSLAIQLNPVDPRTMLEQLAKDFDPQAKAKKLTLKVEIAPHTPSILSSEHYIREILQNYLSNAIKYTPIGGITLGAAPNPEGGVMFRVRDTGIGIAPNNQSHLFTKFFRVEDYRTRETGGTGLGLYLSLELAERLSGKVWCESTFGEGSTFFLEVPPFSRLKQDRAKVVEAQVSSLVDQL